MFCRNCGNGLLAGAAFCTECGSHVADVTPQTFHPAPAAVPPAEPAVSAQVPAAPVAPVIAPSVAPVSHQEVPIPPAAGYPGMYPAVPTKKRNVAITLAVFLGYWSWLYTPKKNLLKFFLALAASIVAGLMIQMNMAAQQLVANAYTSCIISDLNYGTDSNCQNAFVFDPDWSMRITAGWLVYLAIYLWSLIDNIRHSASYYEGYPNVKK
ncbi:hypothetical protein M2113_000005 [Aurantimicrobium minutum]|nr:hypothetical protein [Aurantimicrobium minutum]